MDKVSIQMPSTIPLEVNGVAVAVPGSPGAENSTGVKESGNVFYYPMTDAIVEDTSIPHEDKTNARDAAGTQAHVVWNKTREGPAQISSGRISKGNGDVEVDVFFGTGSVPNYSGTPVFSGPIVNLNGLRVDVNAGVYYIAFKSKSGAHTAASIGATSSM